MKVGSLTATSGPSILKWFILEHWDKSLPLSATGQPGMLEGELTVETHPLALLEVFIYLFNT